jgi:hypothetical protein
MKSGYTLESTYINFILSVFLFDMIRMLFVFLFQFTKACRTFYSLYIT